MPAPCRHGSYHCSTCNPDTVVNLVEGCKCEPPCVVKENGAILFHKPACSAANEWYDRNMGE